MDFVSSVDFKVTCAELVPGAYVVTLGGDADPFAVPALTHELQRLADGGAREIVVDLLDVPFIDSTVLGVLLTTSRRLRADGGQFVLVTDDPRVLRAFEITGLATHFCFEPTLASAVDRALENAYRT